MKVEKVKKEFEPVVITLERAEEAACMTNVLLVYLSLPDDTRNSCCTDFSKEVFDGMKTQG